MRIFGPVCVYTAFGIRIGHCTVRPLMGQARSREVPSTKGAEGGHTPKPKTNTHGGSRGGVGLAWRERRGIGRPTSACVKRVCLAQFLSVFFDDLDGAVGGAKQWRLSRLLA